MSRKILLYTGEGAEPSCVKALSRFFLMEGHSVNLCDENSITKNLHQSAPDWVVFPGGRDCPYHKKLKGGPNEAIRNFVADGGKYLGICAGGYYGAAEVSFDLNGPLEVHELRQLQFFPGVAAGPAYLAHPFAYESKEGVHLAKLRAKGEVYYAYFNGGCYFRDVEKFTNTEVVARYDDLPSAPAAIVRCKWKKGVAILSGVHLEHSLASLRHRAVFDLSTENQRRIALFRSLLQT